MHFRCAPVMYSRIGMLPSCGHPSCSRTSGGRLGGKGREGTDKDRRRCREAPLRSQPCPLCSRRRRPRRGTPSANSGHTPRRALRHAFPPTDSPTSGLESSAAFAGSKHSTKSARRAQLAEERHQHHSASAPSLCLHKASPTVSSGGHESTAQLGLAPGAMAAGMWMSSETVSAGTRKRPSCLWKNWACRVQHRNTGSPGGGEAERRSARTEELPSEDVAHQFDDSLSHRTSARASSASPARRGTTQTTIARRTRRAPCRGG